MDQLFTDFSDFFNHIFILYMDILDTWLSEKYLVLVVAENKYCQNELSSSLGKWEEKFEFELQSRDLESLRTILGFFLCYEARRFIDTFPRLNWAVKIRTFEESETFFTHTWK